MAHIWSIKKQSRAGNRGTRAIFGGGYVPDITNKIEYITIATTGDAADFGDLDNRADHGAYGGAIRGLFTAGKVPGAPDKDDEIHYVTIASTGNSASFGDCTNPHRNCGGGCGSDTRGMPAIAGYSEPGYSDIIDYVTLATTGNAIDFGDVAEARAGGGAFSSPTRGFFFGGQTVGWPRKMEDEVEYFTIASTGDAADFGDLTTEDTLQGSACSHTRGIAAGGRDGPSPTITNAIDYFTLATTGNATDFGNLTEAKFSFNESATGSITRGIFGGGNTGSYTDVIEYITIATTGDAADFGDLSAPTNSIAGCSNAHGGLNGGI